MPMRLPCALLVLAAALAGCAAGGPPGDGSPLDGFPLGEASLPPADGGTFSTQPFEVTRADGDVRLRLDGNGTGEVRAFVVHANRTRVGDGALDLRVVATGPAFAAEGSLCVPPGDYLLVAEMDGFVGEAHAQVRALDNRTCPLPPLPPAPPAPPWWRSGGTAAAATAGLTLLGAAGTAIPLWQFSKGPRQRRRMRHHLADLRAAMADPARTAQQKREWLDGLTSRAADDFAADRLGIESHTVLSGEIAAARADLGPAPGP